VRASAACSGSRQRLQYAFLRSEFNCKFLLYSEGYKNNGYKNTSRGKDSGHTFESRTKEQLSEVRKEFVHEAISEGLS
jgi:hypothetical protein